MARQQPKPSPDDILTSRTAAEMVGLERVYLARLIREGKGPAH